MKKKFQYLIILGICILVLGLSFAVNRCANEFSAKPPFESDTVHTKKAELHHDTATQLYDTVKAQIEELEALKGTRAYNDSLIEFDNRTRARIRKELRFPD